MNRRKFIKAGVIATAALAIAPHIVLVKPETFTDALAQYFDGGVNFYSSGHKVHQMWVKGPASIEVIKLRSPFQAGGKNFTWTLHLSFRDSRNAWFTACRDERELIEKIHNWGRKHL